MTLESLYISILNSITFEMIDFSKAYCNLHPHELVMNFCTRPECLTGLCANCICTHTEAHVQNGTKPEYENIRVTYKKIQENIRQQIEAFEGDKQRIAAVYQKLQEKRENVREVIQVAQDDAIKTLQLYFEEKQNRMLREIDNEEKRNGLHCEGRLESMSNAVSREISLLVSATQDISSQNFLESLPRMRTQIMVNAEAVHLDVDEELVDNENFHTTITYQRSRVNELGNLLDQILWINIAREGQPSRHHSARRATSETKAHCRSGIGRPQSPGKIAPRNIQSQLNFAPTTSQLGTPYPVHRQLQNTHDGIHEGSRLRNSYLNQSPITATYKPMSPFRQETSSTFQTGVNPLQPPHQKIKLSMMNNDQSLTRNYYQEPFQFAEYLGPQMQGKPALGKKSRKSGLRVFNQQQNLLALKENQRNLPSQANYV